MPEAKPAVIRFAPLYNLMFYQVYYRSDGFSAGSGRLPGENECRHFFDYEKRACL